MPKCYSVVSDSPTEVRGVLLKPRFNLITGETAFMKAFGPLKSLESDLLRLAAAVYAVDVAEKRGECELYSRELEIRVPVANFHAFSSVKDVIEESLYLLTNDDWKLIFHPLTGGVPEGQQRWPVKKGDVLLFSGGLDSFAYAVALAEAGDDLLLVSHDSGNAVNSEAQNQLSEYVASLKKSKVQKYVFRVRGQRSKEFPYPTEHEPSQRSRSFLFLSLAALVARRSGRHRIIFIAENGQLAIHVPITAARLGAYSTRTAHPEVIYLLQQIFASLLQISIQIENPFLYKTKAEVVEHLCRSHSQVLSQTVSCWKASRVTGANHCGFCVPCIIRRIALEHWNAGGYTRWGRDLFAERIVDLPPEDEGKRNLTELCEFYSHFWNDVSDANLWLRFPELVSLRFSLNAAIDLYRRAAREARAVFSRYPRLAEILR